ncbi:MAG: DNA repair protein RecO [Patescibacteria group bacterium]|jgi:DNA repair protein RecO (recombination protein O)
MEYYTAAIVLSKSDVKEYDRFFSLYTKNLGKISVLARGVRRLQSKMAGHLEPFGVVVAKIVLGNKSARLSNIETIERYQNIIKDLDSLRLAKKCLTVINNLVKEGSCDLGIFELLSSILSNLDDRDRLVWEKEFLFSVFILKLLVHLGYRPELCNCVICKNRVMPEDNIFDFLRGGLVCGDCKKAVGLGGSGQFAVSSNEIKVLRLMLEKDLEFFSKNKINKKLADFTGNLVKGFARVVGEVDFL